MIMQTSPPPSSPDIARPPRRLRSLLAQRRRAPGRRSIWEEPAGPGLKAAWPELSLAAKVPNVSVFNAGPHLTISTHLSKHRKHCIWRMQ